MKEFKRMIYRKNQTPTTPVKPTDCYFLKTARYSSIVPTLPSTSTLNYLRCDLIPQGFELPLNTDVAINECVRIETIESSIVNFFPENTLFNSEVDNAIANNSGIVSRTLLDGEILIGRVTLIFSQCL